MDKLKHTLADFFSSQSSSANLSVRPFHIENFLYIYRSLFINHQTKGGLKVSLIVSAMPGIKDN